MQSYSLTRLSNSLTPEENKVFELQHAKPVFGRYGDIELLTEVQLLLFKLSVITGWKLPEDESYLTVLVDQFVKKIKEDYSVLNTEEVEHAFRKNTQVKDWGKAFNLSLIDQVLIPYINQRREIKEFVERLPQTERLLPMQADWKELCEMNYQQYLTGNYNVDLWPWQMYDEFVKCGMMEESVFEDYKSKSKKLLESKIRLNIFMSTSAKEKNEYQQHLLKLEDGEYDYRIDQDAKKKAIEVLYQTAKENNYTQLFIKE